MSELDLKVSANKILAIIDKHQKLSLAFSRRGDLMGAVNALLDSNKEISEYIMSCTRAEVQYDAIIGLLEN